MSCIPTIVRKYGKKVFYFRGSTIKVTIKYAFNLMNVHMNVPVNDTVSDTVNNTVPALLS